MNDTYNSWMDPSLAVTYFISSLVTTLWDGYYYYTKE